MHASLSAAAVLAGLVVASTAIAQPAATNAPTGVQGETRLLLEAQAEVAAVPDIAEVGAGVLTQGKEASAALEQNAASMTGVIAALRKAGVAERDIQTSGLRVEPRFRYQQDQAPELVGFQASNRVRAIIRDPKATGRVVDALVSAGANQIDGPNFTIEQPEPLLDKARVEAIALARARADLYARAAGMTVRRIVSIRESGIAEPPQPMGRSADMVMMSAAKESSPVAPGQVKLNAGVQVEFALQ